MNFELIVINAYTQALVQKPHLAHNIFNRYEHILNKKSEQKQSRNEKKKTANFSGFRFYAEQRLAKLSDFTKSVMGLYSVQDLGKVHLIGLRDMWFRDFLETQGTYISYHVNPNY